MCRIILFLCIFSFICINSIYASKTNSISQNVERGQKLKKASLDVNIPAKVKVVEQKQKIPSKKSSTYKLSAKLIRGAKTMPSLEFKTDELEIPMAQESLDINVVEKLDDAQSIAPLGEGGW